MPCFFARHQPVVYVIEPPAGGHMRVRTVLVARARALPVAAPEAPVAFEPFQLGRLRAGLTARSATPSSRALSLVTSARARRAPGVLTASAVSPTSRSCRAARDVLLAKYCP